MRERVATKRSMMLKRPSVLLPSKMHLKHAAWGLEHPRVIIIKYLLDPGAPAASAS